LPATATISAADIPIDLPAPGAFFDEIFSIGI
jgi:hypothetical protein